MGGSGEKAMIYVVGDRLMDKFGHTATVREISTNWLDVTLDKTGALASIAKSEVGHLKLWNLCPVPEEKPKGNHYKDTKFEPFEVLIEWQKTWPPEIRYHLGNILKYVARLGRKDEVLMELKKIKHYAEESIRVLEAEKSK